MIIAVVLIFLAVALSALGFVCWPLWRGGGTGRILLVSAAAVFMIGIAGGSYIALGHPELALRSFENPRSDDLSALVSRLAWRVRDSRDPRGWLLLGKGYLSLNDPKDAAEALKRALLLSPQPAPPELYSAYGEALTMAAEGAVPPEAETAFRAALAGDPKDFAARFYLGQALVQRHDVAGALTVWEGLLADAPADAPWRQMLIDRVALLKAGSQAAPPNVEAMVSGLAERLKAHPNDPMGWRRLVRAYVVLGQSDRAATALAEARKALAGDKTQLAALDAEAHDLHLDK